MEEVDDLGVVIKKPLQVDDLGVPLKKKLLSEPPISSATTESTTLSDGGAAQESSSPNGLTADINQRANELPSERDRLVTRMKEIAIEKFNEHPEFYSNPTNRDSFYKGLSTRFNPKEMEFIVGEDKDVGIGAPAEMMFAPVPTSTRVSPISNKQEPTPPEQLSKDVPQVLKAGMNVGKHFLETEDHLLSGGAQKFKEGIKEFVKPKKVIEGDPDELSIDTDKAKAALHTLVGAGEVAFGISNVASVPLAAFTAALNEAPKEVTKLITPTEWDAYKGMIKKVYTDKGKEPPAWVEDIGSVINFGFGALAIGGAYKGAKNWSKALKETLKDATPEQINQFAEKLEQGEHIRNTEELNQVKGDINNNPDLAPHLQEKVTNLETKVAESGQKITAAHGMEMAAKAAALTKKETLENAIENPKVSKATKVELKKQLDELPKSEPEPVVEEPAAANPTTEVQSPNEVSSGDGNVASEIPKEITNEQGANSKGGNNERPANPPNEVSREVVQEGEKVSSDGGEAKAGEGAPPALRDVESTAKALEKEGLKPALKNNGDGEMILKVDDTKEGGKRSVGMIGLKMVEIDGKKFLSIGMTNVREGYEGKGLATNMYRYLMENLPEGYDGILSPKETRWNKDQIPKIHEKLSKEYDKTELENGDIIFKPKSESLLSKEQPETANKGAESPQVDNEGKKAGETPMSDGAPKTPTPESKSAPKPKETPAAESPKENKVNELQKQLDDADNTGETNELQDAANTLKDNLKKDSGEENTKAFIGRTHQSKAAMETKELQEAVEEHGLNYEVEKHETVTREADAFIAQVGIDNAMKAVREGILPVESATRAAVFIRAIEAAKKEAYAEKDPTKKLELIKKAAELSEEMGKQTIGAGRFNSYLQEAYLNSDIGYELGELLNRAKRANKDEALSPKQEKEFARMAEEIESLNEKIAEQKELLEQKRADTAFEKIQKAKELEDSLSKSNPKESVKKVADRIIENNKKKKGEEYDLIFESAKRDIIAQRVAKEITSDTSNKNINAKIDNAVDKLANEGLIKPENVQKAKEYFKDSAKETSKLEVTPEGKLKIPDNLLYDLVQGGIDNINDLAKAVREKLTPEEQGRFSERDVRDSITKYGEQKLPSADEIKQKIAELKRTGQLVSGLEDATSGKSPKKTGWVRQKVTQLQRDLIKKIKDAMKEHPEDAADVERKWASANDKITTTLKNKVADLERQLELGKRDERSNKTIERSELNKALQEQIDALNKALDDLVGKKEQTHEQKVNNAVTALENAAKEYERRTKEKDFGLQVKTKLESPLIDAAKAARDIAKEQFEIAKDEFNPKESALQKLVDSQENFTKEIEQEAAKEKPSEEKLIELKKKRDASKGQISNLVDAVIKLNTDPAQVEIARKIKAKEAAINNLKDKLSKNDLSTKDKSQGATSPELKALEKEHEVLIKDLNDRRKNANKKSQALIDAEELLEAIKQKTKTRDDIVDKLNTNNLSKKTRTPQSYDNNPTVKQLNKEIEQANKLLQQKRNALKTKKTASQKATESALKSAERELKNVTDKLAKQKLDYDTRQSKVVQNTLLKATQDALKDARKVLEVAREQSGVAQAHRGKLYKEQLQREIDNMNEQLRTGVFDKIKKPRTEDAETIRLETEKLQTKEKVDLAIEKIKLQRENEAAKNGDIEAIKNVTARIASDILNIERSILASGDLSAVLNQGGILSIKHPVLAKNAMAHMLKTLTSQEKADQWLREVKASGVYPAIRKAGLYLAEPTTKLTAREEMFTSNLVDKIPVLGTLTKGSNRAYTGFLNKLRVDVFNQFHELLVKDGFTGKELEAELKAYADFINNATGRGAFPEKLAGLAPVVNGTMFSPRYLTSRFKLLFDAATFIPKEVAKKLGYKKMEETTRARREAMKEVLAYGAVVGTIIMLSKAAGADVEDNSRSSDWAKIKINNTRIDLLNGFQQIYVLITRLWTHQTKSLKTGEIRDLGTGGGDPYEGTKLGVAQDFLESKASPQMSKILDWSSGKFRYDKKLFGHELAKAGDKFNWTDATLANLQFMWQQDLWDIAKERDAAETAALGGLSFLGGRVQHFDTKKKSSKTNHSSKQNNKKNITPEKKAAREKNLIHRKALQEEIKRQRNLK